MRNPFESNGAEKRLYPETKEAIKAKKEGTYITDTRCIIWRTMTKRIKIDAEYRINIHIKKGTCKCYAFFRNEGLCVGQLAQNRCYRLPFSTDY